MYPEHIRDALSAIAEYMSRLDRSGFLANRMVQDDVIRKFEMLGEAARRLSEEYRSAHAEGP